MSAATRDFTNFKSFPGKINEGTDNYEFPTLYKIADTGKNRQWTIYVRLIKEASKKAAETKKQNWNLLAEDQIPIKKEYLRDDIDFPEGILAQLWTESGFTGMKISRSAPLYAEVKNRGKKNERNVFHQALVMARAKYLKKIEDGSSKNSEEISGIKETKYFPMLAKNYKDIKKIEYPVYIQPKLDGLRCLAYLDKNPDEHKNITSDDVILYSRQKKEYPTNASNKAIRVALLPVLIKYYIDGESLYLDGELYKHGKSLQNLSSVTRGSDSKECGEYHIYDMFYPSYNNKDSFEKRTNILKNVYNSLQDEHKKIIKYVPTHYVRSRDDEDKLYREFLNKGYEGIMIRSPEGAYAKSATKKSSSLRSKNLLKRKEVLDGEYEVVGYTGGSGKDSEAVVWICSTPTGKTFNVVPNITYEERYRVYKDCEKNFERKYKNRMLLIEYRSLTDSGVPSHARGIDFRDFK